MRSDLAEFTEADQGPLPHPTKWPDGCLEAFGLHRIATMTNG